MHDAGVPLEDAHSCLHEVPEQEFGHIFFKEYVGDSLDYPAYVHPAPGRLLEGVQRGFWRGSVGGVYPEIPLCMADRPFKEVPHGEFLVYGGVVDHLNGFSPVLDEAGDIVFQGLQVKVICYVERLCLRVQAQLVLHVHRCYVLNCRAGNPYIGIPPGGEILVLDVAAAKVCRCAVCHEDLAVVTVSPGRWHKAIYEPHGLVEAVEEHSGFRETLQGLVILRGFGGLIHHHPHVQALEGFVPQDIQHNCSGGIGTNPVIIHIDGLGSRLEVLKHQLELVVSVRDEPYGVPRAWRNAGIFLHQSSKLLVLRLHAGVQGAVRHLRDVGSVQRRPIAAAGKH